jgi:hypothetical protein
MQQSGLFKVVVKKSPFSLSIIPIWKKSQKDTFHIAKAAN